MESFIRANIYLVTFLLGSFLSTVSQASLLWMGLGTVTHNFKTAQTDTAGDSTKTMNLTPTLLIGTSMPVFFFGSTYFSPGIGYAKYFGMKDGYTKNEIILQYHFNYAFSSSLALRYGFSNYITMIGGSGGTQSLNNGSSTSTFYVPSKTKSSYTASFDLGPEFIFSSQFTLRTQLSVERFTSSTRRTLAHLITLNYFL